MQVSEQAQFFRMLQMNADYYGKRLSPTMLDVYWGAFKAYDIQDITRAMSQHIQNPDGGQFMPKVADLLRHLEGTAETRALLAWSKVQHAMRRAGVYDNVAFDDEIIHAVLYDMGGLATFCMCQAKDLVWRGQEFQKRYVAYCSKPPVVVPSLLEGYASGSHIHFIGDSAKARALLKASRERQDHVLSQQLAKA